MCVYNDDEAPMVSVISKAPPKGQSKHTQCET